MADPNEPGSGVVPSARAERRRIFSDDALGIVVYAVVIAAVSALVVVIVALAR